MSEFELQRDMHCTRRTHRQIAASQLEDLHEEVKQLQAANQVYRAIVARLTATLERHDGQFCAEWTIAAFRVNPSTRPNLQQ